MTVNKIQTSKYRSLLLAGEGLASDSTDCARLWWLTMGGLSMSEEWIGVCLWEAGEEGIGRLWLVCKTNKNIKKIKCVSLCGMHVHVCGWVCQAYVILSSIALWSLSPRQGPSIKPRTFSYLTLLTASLLHGSAFSAFWVWSPRCLPHPFNFYMGSGNWALLIICARHGTVCVCMWVCACVF